MPNIDLKAHRIAVTGGTSGLGLALVKTLVARGARVAFVARSAPQVEQVAKETGACGIVGDVGRKEDIYAIALESPGILAAWTRSSTTPRASGRCRSRSLADTECEDFLEAPRRQPHRPVPLDQSPVRRAGGLRARGPRRRRRQHFERRGGDRLSRLGRLRRVQGGAPPPDGDLGRGGEGRRGEVSLARPRRHGYASARAGRARRQSDNTEASRRRGKRDRRIASRRASSARAACAARMTAAGRAGRQIPRLLVVEARARTAICRGLRWRLFFVQAISSSPTTRRRCRRASGRALRQRRDDRGQACRVGRVSRSHALRGGRLRRRRLSHAHGRAPSAAKTFAGRPAHARAARGVGRGRARPSAAHSPSLRGGRAGVLRGLASHGRPIQYAHVARATGAWGRVDKDRCRSDRVRAAVGGLCARLAHARGWRVRGVAFATLSHAAGLSSTGDPMLDRRLPFDEFFRISDACASAVRPRIETAGAS